MKNIFYFIVLTFAFTQVRSQSTYNLELDGVEASTCILTKDSCILIAGSVDAYGSYVAKLDSNGNILWDRIYINSAWQWFDCATTTSDSGFALVGHSGYTQQTFYLKINAIGDTVWTGAININANYINSFQETIDHGFVFSTTEIIVKIDSNGVFQ